MVSGDILKKYISRDHLEIGIKSRLGINNIIIQTPLVTWTFFMGNYQNVQKL